MLEKLGNSNFIKITSSNKKGTAFLYKKSGSSYKNILLARHRIFNAINPMLANSTERVNRSKFINFDGGKFKIHRDSKGKEFIKVFKYKGKYYDVHYKKIFSEDMGKTSSGIYISVDIQKALKVLLKDSDIITKKYIMIGDKEFEVKYDEKGPYAEKKIARGDKQIYTRQYLEPEEDKEIYSKNIYKDDPSQSFSYEYVNTKTGEAKNPYFEVIITIQDYEMPLTRGQMKQIEKIIIKDGKLLDK
ncbi:MAG: hypothetical protein ABIH00_11655 [Armatimonadota bacterium]